jgi:hypothetical protein
LEAVLDPTVQAGVRNTSTCSTASASNSPLRLLSSLSRELRSHLLDAPRNMQNSVDNSAQP